MAEEETPEAIDGDLISQTSFEELYGQGAGALPPAGRAHPRMPWEKPVAVTRELPRLSLDPEPAPEPTAAETPPEEPAAPPAQLPEPSPEPESSASNSLSGTNLFHTQSMRPLAGLDAVRQALDRAGDHQQVGWVLARHALSKARRVVLLVRRGAPWVGWTGAGEGVVAERVASVVIPPVEGTIFGLVTETGGHYLGPLARHPVHQRFLRTVGMEAPASLGLFPIHYDGRVSMALYLDGGPGGHLSPDIAEILVIAQQVPAVLARLANSNPAGPGAAGGPLRAR